MNSERLDGGSQDSVSWQQDGVFLQNELAILANGHPNVLFVGPAAATDLALQVTLPHLRMPVAVWAPGESSDLPTGSCGTLVVRGLDAADARQQSRLDAWLEGQAGAVQVLSTTATPLFPQVERGVFDERLYYRVNHVYLDLCGS